jgi:hypothetical protein
MARGGVRWPECNDLSRRWRERSTIPGTFRHLCSDSMYSGNYADVFFE